MASRLADQLANWFRGRLPAANNIELKDMRAASSGLSAETLVFTLNYCNPKPKSERLVLRSGPKGRGIFPDYDLGLQAGVMRALRSTPLPAPVVRWYEPAATAIGSAFIVMDYVDGQVPSDTPPGLHGKGLFFDASETERVAMWRAGIEQVARLHALDWRSLALPSLPGSAPDVERSIAGQIRLLESWVRWGEMESLMPIQKGLRWLKETPVPTARLSLVWGDARPGNIIYSRGQPAAVLDWELASIGIAEFDLFYWLWSTQLLAEVNGLNRLPGLPDAKETCDMYAESAGRPVVAAEYCEMFTIVRLAIMGALGARASISDIYSSDYVMNNGAMRAVQAALC